MELSFLAFLAPLLMSIIFALPWKFSEKAISYLTLTSLVIALWGVLFQFDLFIVNGFKPFEVILLTFKVGGHEFIISSWIDKFGLGYLTISIMLAMMVTKFSHTYLNLEKGYQRFFATILFFVFGLIVLSLAGHLDLFFAGWEIVGFSSFLLISFYRHHSRSVNSAFNIYTIYRICDVGLLSGAVLGHILWKEAATFSVLNDLSIQVIQDSQGLNLLIFSLCLILASLGKSAQFPFYNWPARAMEGPTPSSAIFYGALSIHAGVLLLIRTEVVWSHVIGMKIIVGLVGLITFILSRFQKQVQSNIKGKIAYKVTSHLGIMFILLSFELFDFVFVYMMLHAIYRCFEILISPSIVASSDSSNNKKIINKMNQRRSVPATLYLLSSLDFGFYFSFKRFCNQIGRWLVGGKHFGIVIFLIGGVTYLIKFDEYELVLGGVGVYFSLRALFFHSNAFKIILNIFTSIIFMILSFVDSHEGIHLASSFLLPIFPALMLILFIVFFYFRNKNVNYYHGLGSGHVWQANTFMLAFMVLAGMPVSSAFIAEDLILEYLILFEPYLTLLCLLILMLNGVSLAKVYTKLFMGRVSKWN